MKRTMRWVVVGLLFSLGWGVAGMQAQQPVAAEPQAPSGTVQAPREVVPPLPVPRLVKFAGTLKDERGKPRTGVVGVTFAVYKEQEGGAALWLETQNAELDEQGHYTVLLGSSKSEGLPLELFTAGEPRWLGVQVNLPKETEQPRVLLVSVPYALKAADAETLGGLPASAFALTAPSGTVPGASVPGITAQTSGNSKAVGKTATSRTTKSAAAATPIAANFIPVFIDSSGTLLSSAMFQSGSNIGIGTTTPATTLDVNGGARALSYQFSGNAPTPTNATATIFDQAFVGPTFSGLSFSVRTGAVPANALSVDSSQNVSIAGNANIGGNAGALAYKFTGNATPPTDATATILNQAFVGPVFSGLSFRVRTGAPVPADALTVASNQNVGIGTTTPAAKLDVAGTGNFTATATTGTTFGVQGNSASTSGIGVFGNAIASTGTTYGVRGVTNSTGGFGVFGGATATSGFSFGVAGSNASTGGIGTDGFAFATTGNTIGTRGIVNSTAGIGVQGAASATSGSATGVQGVTSSSSGIGVDGSNTSTTGLTATGTRGLSANPAGQGVLGEATDTSGGFTIGVHGIVHSANGNAGFFENLGPTLGGNLILAKVLGTTNRFRVDTNGNVFASGSYNCGLASACFNSGIGADVAERIDVTEQLEPGDVVEINPDSSGHFRKVRGAYSTMVAGIVSTIPGVTLGNNDLDHSDAGVRTDARPLLALVGRVPVKVTDEGGAVRTGDLLTSSSTPGYAMRCTNRQACAGAIVGKALEPLKASIGVIQALATLQ